MQSHYIHTYIYGCTLIVKGYALGEAVQVSTASEIIYITKSSY